MPLTPNLVYEDGSYAVASPISLPQFSAPFADQGINIDYLLTQDYVQNLADFVPLALDTAHEDYAEFKLASEGDKRDLGGGKIQWTRTYAKLPDEFSRPNGNVTYNFIGYAGIGFINTPGATWRPRISKAVPAKSTKTFYRTADPLIDIPFIPATRYYFSGSSNQDVDELTTNPPFLYESVPSRTAYEAMITADATASSYSIVAEASRVSIWMGNIYMRETIYIKAQ